MSEMVPYPLVRAFLTKLLHLSEPDAQLPLELLISMHRTALAAPLLQVSNMATASPEGWEQDLRQNYPAVVPEVLFSNNPELRPYMVDYYRNLPMRFYTHRSQRPSRGSIPWLLEQSDGKSSIHLPAVFLYRVGLRDVLQPKALQVLEALLGLHPGIRVMLLDLAARYRMETKAPGQQDAKDERAVGTAHA